MINCLLKCLFSNNDIYVANYGSRTVFVIYSTNNMLIGSIVVEASPTV